MKIGYARVSTEDQNLGVQIRALEEAGCEAIFQEHTTGTEGLYFTLMIDYCNYTASLGMLGSVADKLFLESYVRKLLESRNVIIKKYAETGQ